MTLKNLTPLNGFDKENLDSAKQNNYAWSICELEEYIYVGACKNMGLDVIEGFVSRLGNIKLPAAISVKNYDDRGEIWRYKKDGSRKWERVYKVSEKGNNGFRYMINYAPYNARKALLASSASIDNSVSIKILMTYDGVYWREVQGDIKGNSSRSMEVHNGKIYVATSVKENKPYLYSSANPEIEPWTTILDSDVKGFNSNKNPVGTIYNIKSFNNHLYVAVSSDKGAEVWRSNSNEPRMNDWTMIGKSGYGEKENKIFAAMNVYKDHLYFSTIGEARNIYLMPKGAELVRVDKYDNYEVIVGNKNSKSGYSAGFDNPFNLYVWQICEYNDDLYVTTFDHASNLQTVLEIVLLNKELIQKYLNGIGYTKVTVEMLIEAFKKVLKVFNKINYQYGFDIFVSHNGVDFKPVVLDGLRNAENYGGRILYVDSENDLYIGTANAYDGCEVWRSSCSVNSKCDSYEEQLRNIEIMKVVEEILDLFK